MLYDYYGFPPESYEIKYPAPGEPSLAQEMVAALKSNGLAAELDGSRPFDHGVFVPLMIMFPEAKIPVLPISVLRGGDPAEHIRMGEALRPFRSRGVFFLGSGSTMHHFSHFNKKDAGKRFGDALSEVLCASDKAMPPEKRMAAVKRVTAMAGFDEAQPRGALEHLMPLFTLFGTANGTQAKEVANVPFFEANVRHHLFPN
ncbi:extradiol ring-cleavage dioxygenase class III protein subunit B [Trypanosoma conorhini]|uniref:Extradiol ring-cleavage dioxygenase class III protein subunit B n=1 Tax=Trypanosoma conorhini TaxID=83891 RepID=A0A3R7N641_9TRYP|nr:extradiol ring-cleavage dioxygenase class III protein subunit B [Trypanosoma conorhini]RNE97150.1 extradiol ring-cleavage dioxygenase class III protein subunit B [Trypanosoma conorhini]